jgi:hypothetical protein
MVEIHDRISAPEAILQLLTGDDLAGPLQQGSKDLEWLALELNPEACFPKLTGLQIRFEQPESDFSTCSRGGHLHGFPRALHFTTV